MTFSFRNGDTILGVWATQPIDVSLVLLSSSFLYCLRPGQCHASLTVSSVPPCFYGLSVLESLITFPNGFSLGS